LTAWPELDRLNAAEPSIELQVRKRALLICRHDNWPALTPDKLWLLDFDLWPQLAIACDQIQAERERQAREMERRRR